MSDVCLSKKRKHIEHLNISHTIYKLHFLKPSRFLLHFRTEIMSVKIYSSVC